jgi:hypothetical protein
MGALREFVGLEKVPRKTPSTYTEVRKEVEAPQHSFEAEAGFPGNA